MDLQGSLVIQVNNPQVKRPLITLDLAKDSFQYKLSPICNKQEFTKGIIQLKETNPSVKTNEKIEVLKYSLSSKHFEDNFFFEISTWFSDH